MASLLGLNKLSNYYRKPAVDEKLVLKADTSALHQDYYTKADIDDTLQNEYYNAAENDVILTVFSGTVSARLGTKANLDSPALVGLPTAPTAAQSSASTQLATTAFVHDAVLALVDGAPAALNTLNELAVALNSGTLATTVIDSLALKAPLF